MTTEQEPTYPGDEPGCADVRFGLTEWVRTQEDLAGADAILRMLAHQHGWTFAGNERGYWPARSVSKQGPLHSVKVAVVLDEAYLDSRVRTYSVIRSQGIRTFLGRKDTGFTVIASLSSESARDVVQLRALLEAEVGPLNEE